MNKFIQISKMRIVTKEIDQYTSMVHADKMISEYIIYLMVDDMPIEAYTELGIALRDKRIEFLNRRSNAELQITHFSLIN